MKYPPKFTRRFRIVIVMNVIFLKLKKKRNLLEKLIFISFGYISLVFGFSPKVLAAGSHNPGLSLGSP